MHRTLSYTAIVVWLFVRATVIAQLGDAWTFDALRAKSDLVVIAERVSTSDTGIAAELTDLRPPFPVVEMHTEFKVLSTLQGTPLGMRLVLRHYRRDTDRLPGGVLNAPLGLDFTKGPTAVYLLFLTRESGDVYAPTSGHVFPEMSILALPRSPLTMLPR